jgi:hypothetical protein
MLSQPHDQLRERFTDTKDVVCVPLPDMEQLQASRTRPICPLVNGERNDQTNWSCSESDRLPHPGVR